MKRCHFTESAERDLEAIAEYSYARWGLERAIRYVESLRSTAQMLAKHPDLGRTVSKHELRRSEDLQHVLFYRPVDDGIEIVCVLHERQDPDNFL
jgi:toxin ParE1/3/4